MVSDMLQRSMQLGTRTQLLTIVYSRTTIIISSFAE
jgi:hypothetical protein